MDKTLNIVVIFLMFIGLCLFSFTQSIRAELSVESFDSNAKTKVMDKKSIDDLLGPDPYLFDPGNHMDDFDSSKSKNKNK